MKTTKLGLVYLLVTTEFKKTEQKLGKLEDFSREISKFLSSIDSQLLEFTEQLPIQHHPRLPPSIIDELRSHDQSSLDHGVLTGIIKIIKEEEKELDKLNQLQIEERILLNYDLKTLYANQIIRGSEFRAVVLNHHFFLNPHLHIVYTILKYDIIRKKLYVDVFVTTTQYIKRSFVRQREFIPKMFDEHLSNDPFIDNYCKKIYETIKSDVNDINLVSDRLTFLNNYLLDDSGEQIRFRTDKFNLMMQRNIVQYLSGLEPIDDNQTKILLSLNGNQADRTYTSVLAKTKRIVSEKKLLENKSYTVVATSLTLLMNGIIYEKEGEEEKHAEAILIENCHRNLAMMGNFKSSDLIYVIRLYQNGSVGSGLPCNRCVRVLHGNGINRVVYSIDSDHFKFIDMNENTYTYTTTGNKLLNTDLYLYDEYIVPKRIRC
jgi:hypothetical protein